MQWAVYDSKSHVCSDNCVLRNVCSAKYNVIIDFLILRSSRMIFALDLYIVITVIYMSSLCIIRILVVFAVRANDIQ